jgi:hypothetical protein
MYLSLLVMTHGRYTIVNITGDVDFYSSRWLQEPPAALPAAGRRCGRDVGAAVWVADRIVGGRGRASPGGGRRAADRPGH